MIEKGQMPSLSSPAQYNRQLAMHILARGDESSSQMFKMKSSTCMHIFKSLTLYQADMGKFLPVCHLNLLT